MNQTKINIVSLGCSKNLVDTELLMKQLEDTEKAAEEAERRSAERITAAQRATHKAEFEARTRIDAMQAELKAISEG